MTSRPADEGEELEGERGAGTWDGCVSSSEAMVSAGEPGRGGMAPTAFGKGMGPVKAGAGTRESVAGTMPVAGAAAGAGAWRGGEAVWWKSCVVEPTADGLAPCAPARRPPKTRRSWPRHTGPCTADRGGATGPRARCCRLRAPCLRFGGWLCVLRPVCHILSSSLLMAAEEDPQEGERWYAQSR